MEARLAELRTTLDAGIHQRDTVLNTIGYNLEKWTDKVQGSRIPCCFLKEKSLPSRVRHWWSLFLMGCVFWGPLEKALSFCFLFTAAG